MELWVCAKGLKNMEKDVFGGREALLFESATWGQPQFSTEFAGITVLWEFRRVLPDDHRPAPTCLSCESEARC
jgi:hypothetical protein